MDARQGRSAGGQLDFECWGAGWDCCCSHRCLARGRSPWRLSGMCATC
ncbi:hypothetical protein HanHA89_Chr12g0480811 [Helianthus annuus]|nr:hypothetical protein HanHA89_Chr12g0480811 [Helianthus annuus]